MNTIFKWVFILMRILEKVSQTINSNKKNEIIKSIKSCTREFPSENSPYLYNIECICQFLFLN